MENLIGKWVAIPLTELKEGRLNDYIHPDDIFLVQELKQPVVETTEICDSFHKIKVGDKELRIKSTIIQSAQKPEFLLNENVKFKNSKDLIEFGIIRDFYWHVKDNKYIYKIEVNGKLKSNRYYAENIESI
jgi:hypothetical protein